MDDWKDILSDDGQNLSDEDLLNYLSKKGSSAEDVSMLEDLEQGSFEADAIEGLQQIKNTDQVKKHVRQLNGKLHQQLQTSKKKRNEKRNIKDFQWIVITLLILLFICIAGYVIIRMNNSPGRHSGIYHNNSAAIRQ